MAEEIRLDVTSVAHSKGLTDAARDVKGLRGETDKLGGSFGRAEGEAFDLDGAIESARVEIGKLNAEFAKTGDMSLFGDIKGQRSVLAQLEKVREELDKIGESGGGLGVTLGSAAGTTAGRGMSSGILDSLSSMPFRTKAIGALVGLAVLASPMIGGMISGAVVGVAGLGGIAGGIASASKDPHVRAAAKDFGTSISTEFFGSGEAFVRPTIAALGILKKDFAALDLGATFAKGAPAVEILARGVGDLAKNIMPGLNKVMERSPQIAAIMADGFGDVGDSISDMLTTMIESEGTMDGLRALFTLTAGAIRGTGTVLGFLADSFHGMNVAAGRATGVLEDWLGWMPLTGDMLRSVNDRAEEWSGTADNQAHVLGRVSQGQLNLNRLLGGFPPIVADAVDGVRALNEALTSYLSVTMNVDQAQMRVDQGLADLREKLRENRGHWNDNTEAARENRAGLLGQIDALIGLRQKQIDAGTSVKAANKAYNASLDVLLGMARAAGMSKAQLDRLKGRYNVEVVVTAVIDAAAGAAAALARLLNRISFGRRAAGGPVGPGAWLVGEGGRPEVLEIPPGTRGHVYPSVGAYGRSGGGGGGGGTQSVARPVRLSGGEAGEALFGWLVREISRRGGTLAVLGIRS